MRKISMFLVLVGAVLMLTGCVGVGYIVPGGAYVSNGYYGGGYAPVPVYRPWHGQVIYENPAYYGPGVNVLVQGGGNKYYINKRSHIKNRDGIGHKKSANGRDDGSHRHRGGGNNNHRK